MQITQLPTKADWHLVMSVFNDVFPLESKLLSEDDFKSFNLDDYDVDQFDTGDLNFPDVGVLLSIISIVLALVLWRFPCKATNKLPDHFNFVEILLSDPEIRPLFNKRMLRVIKKNQDKINKAIRKGFRDDVLTC